MYNVYGPTEMVLMVMVMAYGFMEYYGYELHEDRHCWHGVYERHGYT